MCLSCWILQWEILRGLTGLRAGQLISFILTMIRTNMYWILFERQFVTRRIKTSPVPAVDLTEARLGGTSAPLHDL